MTSDTKPKFANRLLRLTGRSLLTLGVAGLAGAAILIGIGVLTDRAEAVPEPQAAPPLPVQVTRVSLEEGYYRPRRFVGQIEPRTSVSLSFELGGKLEGLLVEEGDPVQAGQEIARLDTDLLQAEAARLEATRAAADAQLTFAEARLARAMNLQEQGFTSRETLDQALAARDELTSRIAETDAALQSVAINLRKSVLYAPVSGTISRQDADIAETVRAGQEIVTVLQTARPEFRVGLPLDLDADDLARVTVVMDGTQWPAMLKRLRPDIDPVTRTRTAIFELPTNADVLFGRTANLTFDMLVPASGVWVPLDALQSGKGSVWTAMVVVGDRLATAAVEILHIDGARAFVQGTLVSGDEIVTSGAHRVVAGQTVRVMSGED